MSQPLFSVIIPYYNHSKVVGNAISSIYTQTCEDWELTIVDDGSDPEHKISMFDEQAFLYTQKHQGVSAAIQKGIEESTGKYIVLQGADDLSLPDRLERAKKFFEKKPDTDVFVHSLYTNLWDYERNVIVRGYRKAERTTKRELLKNQTINGVPIFKREVGIKLPLRPETKYVSDWMMHLDWYFSGCKYGFSDVATYEYVRSQGSASERYEKAGKRHAGLRIVKDIMKKDYNANFNPMDFEL